MKVSTTISPVTQVALAEVNNAVKKEVCSPALVAKGSINSAAPNKIIRKKPPAISCVPESRFVSFDSIWTAFL